MVNTDTDHVKDNLDVVGIADDIRELRRAAGLTQAALAGRIGIAQSNLARLESGKGNPTLATLHKIAAALQAELRLRTRG